MPRTYTRAHARYAENHRSKNRSCGYRVTYARGKLETTDYRRDSNASAARRSCTKVPLRELPPRFVSFQRNEVPWLRVVGLASQQQQRFRGERRLEVVEKSGGHTALARRGSSSGGGGDGGGGGGGGGGGR